MRPPCLWDKGPPPPNDLTGKIYESIYSYQSEKCIIDIKVSSQLI
jgi:hypothetical protein